MGFLDRLLGRGKEDAEEVKDIGEDVTQKTEDTAESGQERAEDVAQDVRSEVSERTGRDQP